MSTHGVTPITRHEEYYLRDGNICFLVENTVFRLHRYFFERESKYFRDRLNSTAEDGSPDSPYIIRDVKVDEFAQFVWLWYNPKYSFSKKGKDHWLTILRLATEWEFQDVRNLAVRQLERLDLQPVEKIAIYKKYDVRSDLLLPAYVSLCRNEKLPSPEEGKKLSMEIVLKLASAREQILLHASEGGCKAPTAASVPDDVTKAIISSLFELTGTLHSNGEDKTNGKASGDSSVDTEVTTVKPLDSVKGRKSVAEPNVQSQTGLQGLQSGYGKNKTR